MKNHINKSPVCPTCGKYVKFYRFSEGFNIIALMNVRIRMKIMLNRN